MSYKKTKLSRGILHRKSNGFASSHDRSARHCYHCSIHFIRAILIFCGVCSIVWTGSHFHRNVEFSHHDPNSFFQKSLSKQISSSRGSWMMNGNQTAMAMKSKAEVKSDQMSGIGRNIEFSPHAQPRWQVPLNTPSGRLLQAKNWDISPSVNDTFDSQAFEERLQSWREYQEQRRHEEFERGLRYAHNNPKANTNSSVHIVPHLHRVSPMFRRRLSWNMMVMVMADNECPLVRSLNQGGVSTTINATERLLTTVGDALKTSYAHVVVYLPHYSGKQHCRDELYQAIVQTYPVALQIGQLHVITSPLQQEWGVSYSHATNGLDFAYAADFGYQRSDLYLFLQAGSRLNEEWWVKYVPVTTEPPQQEEGDNATTTNKTEPAAAATVDTNTVEWKREILTTNRDYAVEVMLAFEDRLRLDDSGLNHKLCYMNFVENQGSTENRYNNLQNPTGALFESSGLMRLSLTLRSYLPYGTFPVSTILSRYCKNLLWESHLPDSPLLLFQYTSKGNESQLNRGQVDLIPINKTKTFHYINPLPAEIPSWVNVDASMVGPHSTFERNPFLQSIHEAIIPTAYQPNVAEDMIGDKYWLTFVIPTAWRHTAEGATEGNAYVIECLSQLSVIVKNDFTGKYKALILVVVSGKDQADIEHHRHGLKEKFAAEIEQGIIKLVQAPVDHYPTLHGLDIHYKDSEQRVRWRSKQNLDISAAFFAAKGYGKYIMMIEDDSGFRPAKFFIGIKHMVASLHRGTNPRDAVGFEPPHVGQGRAANLRLSSFNRYKEEERIRAYQQGEEPAVTEMGHREIWSQLRFSFGYSGVMVHDEDAFVFGMMHFLLYEEKPCDLLFKIADSIRAGHTKDHFTRWNRRHRFIMHLGKMSTLEGKVFSDQEIQKG